MRSAQGLAILKIFKLSHDNRDTRIFLKNLVCILNKMKYIFICGVIKTKHKLVKNKLHILKLLQILEILKIMQ